MPSNLTGSAIKDTYPQLLHVDGGPTATEKVVYSGTGVATSLKLGINGATISDVQITGTQVAATSGAINLPNVNITNGSISGITDLAIVDGGTGASTAGGARTNLGLGTIATQNSNAISITGGTITGVTHSNMTVDNLNLINNTISSTNTNGNILLTPNGTGEVQISKVAVTAGTIPFGTITGRAYGSFSDITDQTGSTTAATAVKFGTDEITGAGVSVANNGSGNPTRITFTAAGTYMVAPNLQFYNSDAADHDVTVWLMLNGSNVARSATKITVPKSTDGGTTFFQIVFYVVVTASQYVEVMWLPENVAVTIDHTAAAAGPPSVPAIPSAIVIAERIA